MNLVKAPILSFRWAVMARLVGPRWLGWSLGWGGLVLLAYARVMPSISLSQDDLPLTGVSGGWHG